jgi:predicted alpha/beta superfamily hydrolase
MEKIKIMLWVILLCSAFTAVAQKRIQLKNGSIDRIDSFPSKYAVTRRIDVWLPQGYGSAIQKRYAVIYMQDGQNLFMPEYAYGGNEWQADETITRMVAEKRLKDCIIVGIWNTPKRFLEYQPDKVYQLLSDTAKANIRAEYGGAPIADAYLKFMVSELKPFIDKHYHTLKDKANTIAAGSSMGGLISMYALCEYPKVFGGAACISTHWPVSLKNQQPEYPSRFVQYLQTHLPSAADHKLYFDHGNKTLDALYDPYQKQVTRLLTKKWTGSSWRVLIFNGDEHSETSWSKRFNQPLEFLLGTKPVK